MEAPVTVDSLLDRVREIAPIIREHAASAEQERRLARPVVDAMVKAGLFRLWTPKAFGGLEVDPMTAFRVFEEVSRHLIERSVRSPLTEEQIAAGSRQSIVIGDQLGITWIKSYYSAKDGKWYCEYEAPNADLLYEHARLGGFPIDRVYPIDVVVDPAMFR